MTLNLKAFFANYKLRTIKKWGPRTMIENFVRGLFFAVFPRNQMRRSAATDS